jgi:phage/plasmid-associated DNA primase
MLTDHDRDEILKRIQYNTLVDREEFDNGGDIKNVRNGLLNIITKELKPHTPDFLSTQQFSIIYDPNAKWPTETIKFLKEVQNRDGIITLLNMFGYIDD